jgi:hypothetical protein
LPIGTRGGDYDLAIDCRVPEHAVLVWDADIADLGSDDAWVVLAECLEQWMADWLVRKPALAWRDAGMEGQSDHT